MLTINKNSKARSVIMAAAAVLAIGGAMAKNLVVSQSANYHYNGSGSRRDPANFSLNGSNPSCSSASNDTCQYTITNGIVSPVLSSANQTYTGD
ncbi:DUF6520 family protein [Rhizosphaericola mali]|uniref:Uncharacterized protein n=1 Tax=Rhizosphaericola mali TaxID=2545455 RepID=A0A5P2FZU3_9BACT|nr:DUF6520 family protein [Rhizosphaericola mali]QES88745.1 hypothetical protein E0W69_008810 [Rhizosphaericola mali]